MHPPDQNLADQELIRKALAPPSSDSAPTSSITPTGKTAALEKTAHEAKAGEATSNNRSSNTPPSQNLPIFTSKIIKWDNQKGFGFLRHKKGNVFLHRNDFAEHHKRPSKGDHIHYQIGNDSKGRRCAVNARHVNDGGKITIFIWIKLTLLVAMPALAWLHLVASHKLPTPLFILPVIGINLLTYITYKKDKELARAKEWRTSELYLHTLELIGGWPAAFIAQRQFRHKCSKQDFTAVYWMIVLLHLFLAFDYIIDWRVTKVIVHSIMG